MPDLVLYLLKANTALLLFYLAYYLVLRRLTFYHLNRLFLVFGIVFSSVYPFVDVSEMFTQHQELAYAYIPPVTVWVTTAELPAATPSFDYWQIPVILFWAGVLFMFFRLLLQSISLYRIHAVSVPAAHRGVGFRKVDCITQTFSFWQTIYLNPEQHKKEELDAILQHELIHVKGWHTLDVLLVELSTVFYWINPGIWLMKKAIKENLEFIADQNVVSAGVDKKEYQYLLLKVTGNPEPQIANQFNFPSLKRRIVMMNKKKSSLIHVSRYAVLVPLIVAPILFITCSEEDAGMMSPGVTAGNTMEQDDIRVEEVVIPDVHVYIPDASTAPEDYKNFLKQNPEVKHVGWETRETDGSPEIKIFMISESGTGDMYDLNDENSVSAAEAKYGKLPVLPPPPPAPPVPSKQELPPPPPPPYKNDIPVYFPEASNMHDDHKVFLKRNPEVKQLGWMIGDSFGRKVRMLVVYLKSGNTETFDLDHDNSVDMAESKYGELPALPPPPPPVRREN